MKSSSRRYFTPVSSGDESNDYTQTAGCRTYTESDNMDKSKKIIIRIWPYLPARTARASTDYPTACH